MRVPHEGIVSLAPLTLLLTPSFPFVSRPLIPSARPTTTDGLSQAPVLSPRSSVARWRPISGPFLAARLRVESSQTPQRDALPLVAADTRSHRQARHRADTPLSGARPPSTAFANVTHHDGVIDDDGIRARDHERERADARDRDDGYLYLRGETYASDTRRAQSMKNGDGGGVLP